MTDNDPIKFPNPTAEAIDEEAAHAVDKIAKAKQDEQPQEPDMPVFEANDFFLVGKFQMAIEQCLGDCVQIERKQDAEGNTFTEAKIAEDKEPWDRLESLTRSYAQMASGTAARRTSLQERPAPIIQVPK